MHRDMTKLLREYDQRFANGYNRKGRYYFTPEELRQLRDSGSMDPFSLIVRALGAGFVAGYRAAQMDARDQGKQAPTAPRIRHKWPAVYDNYETDETLPF